LIVIEQIVIEEIIIEEIIILDSWRWRRILRIDWMMGSKVVLGWSCKDEETQQETDEYRSDGRLAGGHHRCLDFVSKFGLGQSCYGEAA
jgi:hypothetical protein